MSVHGGVGTAGQTDDVASLSAGAGIPERTLRWAAGAVGGTIAGVERFARGRQAWWIDVRTDDGDVRRWLLKGRRAPASVIARSRLLTDFGPAREAAAMRALAGTGVLIPVVGGFDPASASLLIARVSGSALLQRSPLDERRRVIRHYAQQLAELHRLDWRTLDIGEAIPRPSTAEEMAVGGWLRSAEMDADTASGRLNHAEPLHELAVRWLHRRQPAGRGLDDVRLLHGDAGVNNFLSADGRVTALIDWELAVLGDPMSDLGNARYREALYPTGTYADLIDEYETVTGGPVDVQAVSYYTALAATVLSLGMVANVHRPRASQAEAVARIWQDALARSVACEAIAEADGFAISYDPEPLEEWSAFDPFTTLLVDRLDRAAAEAAPGQPAAEAIGYAQLGRATQAMVRGAAPVGTRFIDEVAPILGRRPSSVPLALGELSSLISAGSGFDLAQVLTVLARDARRRLELLRPLQAAEVWEDADPVVTSDAPSRNAPVLPRLPEHARRRAPDISLS